MVFQRRSLLGKEQNEHTGESQLWLLQIPQQNERREDQARPQTQVQPHQVRERSA